MTIESIESHQPTGAKDGDVDYYGMSFTVSSTIAGNQSGYCYASWSDNTWESQNAYSDYVPTGSYMQCETAEGSGEDGEFAFQLFSPFAIGNWSFQVQQTYLDATATFAVTSAIANISNTTTSYDFSCTINPEEVSSVMVHASGDCSLATNETISIPILSDIE